MLKYNEDPLYCAGLECCEEEVPEGSCQNKSCSGEQELEGFEGSGAQLAAAVSPGAARPWQKKCNVLMY